jgi:hypothetical protein
MLRSGAAIPAKERKKTHGGMVDWAIGRADFQKLWWWNHQQRPSAFAADTDDDLPGLVSGEYRANYFSRSRYAFWRQDVEQNFRDIRSAIPVSLFLHPRRAHLFLFGSRSGLLLAHTFRISRICLARAALAQAVHCPA